MSLKTNINIALTSLKPKADHNGQPPLKLNIYMKYPLCMMHDYAWCMMHAEFLHYFAMGCPEMVQDRQQNLA